MRHNEQTDVRKGSQRPPGVQYFAFGNGQGLVGSLGAMGCLLDGDHTFELIAYRKQKNWGRPCIVDKQSVIKFSADTYPHTFNNYDRNQGRVLIAPHSPDPVFFGIRGESPDIVESALPMLQPQEELRGLDCLSLKPRYEHAPAK